MLKTYALPLICALSLSACGTVEKIPVSVSCPPPPPVPSILLSSPSTDPNLLKRYEDLMKEFSELLSQAVKQ